MAEFETRQPRAPVYGRRAMVVSGHSPATLAGIARARSAAAPSSMRMIAASAALAVVLGHATVDRRRLLHPVSRGGDRPHVRPQRLGRRARRAPRPRPFADGMKIRGPLAPVVPGLVRAWEAMHRRYGKLAWRELLEDAIDLAENGHPVSQVLADRMPEDRALLRGRSRLRRLYLPDGRPVAVGDLFRQPALGADLERHRRGRRRQLLSGRDGAAHRRLFRERRAASCAPPTSPLIEPLWVEPAATNLSRSSRRGDAAQFLRHPAADAARGLGGGGERRPGRRSGAARRLPDERDEGGVRARPPLIADPRGSRRGGAGARAGDDGADARGGARRPRRRRACPNRGGTSCLMLADAEGNAICVVQSVFNVFGSAFLEPATGVIFNNRMQGFTHRPGRPNSVAPGKRPAHTLCPVMVHRDGRRALRAGEPRRREPDAHQRAGHDPSRSMAGATSPLRSRRRAGAMRRRRVPDRERIPGERHLPRSPRWATCVRARPIPISTARPRRSNFCLGHARRRRRPPPRGLRARGIRRTSDEEPTTSQRPARA